MNKVKMQFEFEDKDYNTIKWAMQIIDELATKTKIEYRPTFRSVKGTPMQEDLEDSIANLYGEPTINE